MIYHIPSPHCIPRVFFKTKKIQFTYSFLTDDGFQTSNHCCCSPLCAFQPVLCLSWRAKARTEQSILTILTIAVQNGGITSHVLDREFCLCFPSHSRVPLFICVQHTSHTNPQILLSAQILVGLLFWLLEQNIFLTSSVKWHENNVIWIYSKEQEAPFKIPSPASQDLSKCFKTVYVSRAAVPITQ